MIREVCNNARMWIFFYYFLSIVDCSIVSFRYIAKSFSKCLCMCVCVCVYMYIHIRLFSVSLSQDTEYSFLCSTIGPCLSFLYIVVYISTLAWKIPWMVEPGRLRSMGSLRVGHDWATSLSLFTFTHWRRKWQRAPVFLPGESQGRGNLVGFCLMVLHRVGHAWSDLAAAVCIW